MIEGTTKVKIKHPRYQTSDHCFQLLLRMKWFFKSTLHTCKLACLFDSCSQHVTNSVINNVKPRIVKGDCKGND